MRIRFTLGTLLVALAAAVALASPAMAKGGGGGGGTATAGCATIQSWTNSLQTVNGQTTVVMAVSVFNGCVDEGVGPGKMPAVTMTSTDTATGKWLSASTYMDNFGLNTYNFYASYVPAEAAAPVTLTVTVTRANGKLQDSRSMTLAEVMQSVQPVA